MPDFNEKMVPNDQEQFTKRITTKNRHPIYSLTQCEAEIFGMIIINNPIFFYLIDWWCRLLLALSMRLSVFLAVSALTVPN